MFRVSVTRIAGVIIVVLYLFVITTITKASVACTNNETCVELLWIGSQCVDGWCSNPFESGCLRSLLGTENYKKRICNSDDPPGAAEAGICSAPEPELDHMEIRIINQDWESATLESWLLQIILSELLAVPVTIETGSPNATGSFYDKNNSFHYGEPYRWDALREALRVNGNCRLSKYQWQQSISGTGGPLVNINFGSARTASNENIRYQPCGHVMPEVWNGQRDKVWQLEAEKVIEAPESLGVSGRVSWFVPKFVAERDPTLLNFLGMQGESNRRKLAEFFKRPTTWKDYCDTVSLDGCATDDGVAKRAPRDEAENERFFLQGLYTGHFQSTEENDCDTNSNCTGHIADFPCSFRWSSFVIPQAYHNNIAVQSDAGNDYSRSQLTEMWAAANATKSNLVQYWFTPDMSYQEYLGSDSEFLKVLLPTPTQACIDSRINMSERCSSSEFEKVGKPEGACDNEVESIKKIVVSNLHYINDAPEGRRSPAYDAIKAFSITELQIGKMFDYWLERNIDKWGYDPRYATCRWAAENIDYIKTFIPPTYPRVLRNEQTYTSAFFYTTFAFGSMATLLVLMSMIWTYCQRNRPSIRYAQVEVLFLILSGCLLVSVGSFLLAIEPTYIYCILIPWFITLGYTLELVPVMVKIAAMNRLTSAARRIGRVEIPRKSLFGTVFFLCFFVVLFLFLWTIVDPNVRRTYLEVTEETTEKGATIVTVRSFCQSNRPAWRYISFVWHCLLLISATALAFQNRNMREGFNESQLLAIMIYSKFVFLILRMITFLLEGNYSMSTVAGFRCLIFSLDTIVTILVYFVPKFVMKGTEFCEPVMQNQLLAHESGREVAHNTTMASSHLEPSIRQEPFNPDCTENAVFNELPSFDEIESSSLDVFDDDPYSEASHNEERKNLTSSRAKTPIQNKSANRERTRTAGSLESPSSLAVFDDNDPRHRPEHKDDHNRLKYSSLSDSESEGGDGELNAMHSKFFFATSSESKPQKRNSFSRNKNVEPSLDHSSGSKTLSSGDPKFANSDGSDRENHTSRNERTKPNLTVATELPDLSSHSSSARKIEDLYCPRGALYQKDNLDASKSSLLSGRSGKESPKSSSGSHHESEGAMWRNDRLASLVSPIEASSNHHDKQNSEVSTKKSAKNRSETPESQTIENLNVKNKNGLPEKKSNPDEELNSLLAQNSSGSKKGGMFPDWLYFE